MTAALITVRRALRAKLADTIPDADVFDWHSAEQARSLAVVIGQANCTYETTTMGPASRRQYREHWQMSVEIMPGECRDSEEAAEVVLTTIDQIQDALAEDPRLGGVDSLIRCTPSTIDIRTEGSGAVGHLRLETVIQETKG